MYIGIDEVGRGAWAGPLVVAGVFFTENPGFIGGLNDSKVMTAKKRVEVAKNIMSGSLFVIAEASPAEIDEIGLTEAMRRCVLQIACGMPTDATLLIDGNINYLRGTPYESRTEVLIGADALQPSVMAASILAKVTRDEYMTEQAAIYPEYGFAAHKGYGTKIHAEALRRYGPCQLHRMSVRPVAGWKRAAV